VPRFVVPELIQDACHARALARRAGGWTTRARAPPGAALPDLHHLLRQDTAQRPPMPSRKSSL
jgi:hypothetical protein